jgi:hypothetical protein
MLFGSRTIGIHLSRGLLGAVAAYLAIKGFESHALISVLLMFVVLLLFRGCPMCWLVGLMETIRS